MKFINIVVFAILVMVNTPNSYAVNDSLKQIAVPQAEIIKSGDKILVNSSINISDVELSSNRTMVYYPVLTDGDNVKVLPEVVVNGHRKHILYQRHPSKTAYSEVKRKNDTHQIITYTTSVEYSHWMNKARLDMYVDLCGCGGKAKENITYSSVARMKNDFGFIKHSFCVPEAELEKRRADSGKAYLDFPLNSTMIYSDYHNNANEISMIRETIDKVKFDNNLTITGIEIHGYASPEGLYENNRRLAQGRAQALKHYVDNLYDFKDSVISVKSTPEDIEGLKSYLKNSTLSGADEAIKIIESIEEPDVMEARLRSIDNGNLFRHLLDSCMPVLRHSDYSVHYIARNYTVDEAKEIMKVNPKQLSLNELYMVASTYEPGSSEYNETFMTAVLLFPFDTAANLNASSVALSRNDYAAAEKYLGRADKNNPLTINNMASLELLKGNVDEAMRLYKKAADAGCKEAEENYKNIF